MSDGEIVISLQCWLIVLFLSKSRPSMIAATVGFAGGSIALLLRWLT